MKTKGRVLVIMKERIERFMSGRYGADELSKFMLIVCFVCLILNMFIGVAPVYLIALVLLFICYYRMFSRDYSKRYTENQKYLSYKEKFLSAIGMTKRQRDQRKIYHIYHCPSCKQKIRVPKGKGKICITCPKCKKEFVKKS
jgi:ribosomal protein L37AE/L43A